MTDLDSSAYQFIEVPTLADLLVRACSLHSGRPALSVGPVTRTYDDLLGHATQLARGLVALGVRSGSRVGIYMPNCVEFVEAVFGVAMLGAVVVPINNRFRRRELLHVQTDAGLRVMITSATGTEYADHPARLRQLLADIGPDAPHPSVVVLGDDIATGLMGEAEFTALAGQTDPATVEVSRADVRLRDVAAVLYTSGTTAMPKGCLHTHEGLIRNGLVTGRSRFLLTEVDRFWDPLPMFHVSFLTPFIACVDAGAQMLSMARFEAEAALDLIETKEATWIFASFHAVARSLLDAESFSRRRLESVRMSMCVGHAADLRHFQAAFPSASLLSTYGSTETGGVITYHEPSATAEQRVETCGTPFRGVQLAIKPLDPTNPAAPGEIGEILVRGYSVLDGYLNDPVATEQAIDADRWLHTGDLGSLNSDGHLVFHGRVKDMIKVGGENVSAAEVEALLVEHPDILTANVVAAPDPRLDEVVAAFIELEPGRSLSADQVVAFCEENVARYKVPRHVRFVTEWPMSATKVRKEDLRQALLADLTTPTTAPKPTPT